LQSALDGTRNGGTVVNVLIWGHKRPRSTCSAWLMGELNLIGTAAYCGEHAQIIEPLQQGKIPAEQFITGRIAVDDIVSGGFTELIENKDENVRTSSTPEVRVPAPTDPGRLGRPGEGPTRASGVDQVTVRP